MININIQGRQLAYILFDGDLDNGWGDTGPKKGENQFYGVNA